MHEPSSTSETGNEAVRAGGPVWSGSRYGWGVSGRREDRWEQAGYRRRRGGDRISGEITDISASLFHFASGSVDYTQNLFIVLSDLRWGFAVASSRSDIRINRSNWLPLAAHHQPTPFHRKHGVSLRRHRSSRKIKSKRLRQQSWISKSKLGSPGR